LRAHRRQGGAAALEFALVAGFIFVPLVLGIIQYGWYFFVAQTTGGATSHVARRLAVGDCWGSGQALALVKSEVQSDSANPSVSFTPTTNSAAVIGTTSVSVTVTTHANVVGFWPMPNGGTITRTATTMIEDTKASGVC
jgi:Flp pilus assembly protein TadG